MKDELSGKIIREFISLRPKMYRYRVGKDESCAVHKKCKGIKKCVVKKTISLKITKDVCLREG